MYKLALFLVFAIALSDSSPVVENKLELKIVDKDPNVQKIEVRDSRTINNEVNRKTLPSQSTTSEDSLLAKLNAKCSQRDASSCVMLKLVTYMNRLLKKSAIDISETVVITQTSSVAQGDSSSRSISEDGSEEGQLGQLIADKLWTFVKSRSLKWKIFPEADLVVSTLPDAEGTLNLGMSIRTGKAFESGRGKMKNMGPLLAAGIAKIGMVGILAFKALALLVGKALLVSKLAFLLATVIGLKKLFSQQRHVTYEVVAHPHHSHSHVSSGDHHTGGGSIGGGDSYSSGWGRSIGVSPVASGDPQELAYKAHVGERK